MIKDVFVREDIRREEEVWRCEMRKEMNQPNVNIE